MDTRPINHSANLIDSCIAHMHTNGILFDGCLKTDGELHRFSMDSKKGQPDEWYRCHHGVSSTGIPYLNCYYGTWSGGQETFTYNSYEASRSISQEERAEIQASEEQRKKQLDQELREERKRRIEKAQEIWDQSIQHPVNKQHTSYLERKHVSAYNIKYRVDYQGISSIVIPLCNIGGQLQAVQCIQEDGVKRIYGAKKGNFHLIGIIEETSLIYFAEGYATGASIHQATNAPVVVAMDCGNISPVIRNLREKYPKNQFLIAADNDVESPGNPGKSKAEEAAKQYLCKIALPQFPQGFVLADGKKPTDFNDLHVHVGLEEVKKQLTIKKYYLQALDIADLMSRDFPPRKAVLEPWLPEQGLAMIYAPRGIGKTFLALSIAYAIACGGSILKWKASIPRKVLYITQVATYKNSIALQQVNAVIKEAHLIIKPWSVTA